MRPDGSAKWWWLSPLDRSCWKPFLVSCSAFACSVPGMLLAVTSRPDRGGQVAGDRGQCGAVGLTGPLPRRARSEAQVWTAGSFSDFSPQVGLLRD